MLKNLSKMLFRDFPKSVLSVFPSYLYCAPRLTTFLIIVSECSIRVFHFKMTVLLEY